MKQAIDVPTGKIEVGSGRTILKVNAIGSCVVVSVYSLKKKIGGLAHIMLPGESVDSKSGEERKYAVNAIDAMLKRIVFLGVDIEDIEVCMLGGANVLKRPGETIGKNNVDSIIEILRKRKIKIKAQATGGIERRSLSFDVERGTISYTEGGEDKGLLWIAGQ
ncbi:MAG: chemotaxis protein CheD [Candidatus Omnitrophota bacterium]